MILTAFASYLGIALTIVAGWPAWAGVIAATVPWVLIFTMELRWTYHHFHWLALFYVLVATQGGHVVEHVVQMVQIHILDRTGKETRGIFGNLDIEWVHFGWNTWVLIAVGVLLIRYRRNPWLWLTLVFAGWHEVEHIYIMTKYLSTDMPGNPGLLSNGGAIGGGLDVTRPDLHFLYNVVETTPLFIAFGVTLRQTYDEWLARALPHASADLLISTTKRATSLKFAAGDVIVRQGDLADRFFVLVRGEVEAVTQMPGGGEVTLGKLAPGDFFGEMGLLSDGMPTRSATVRAVTPVEVLALDRSAFRDLMTQSQATAEDLARVASARAGEQSAASIDITTSERSASPIVGA